MAITSKRHPIQDEEKLNNITSWIIPHGYCVQQYSNAGMRHLDWRWNLYSIQLSQLRKVTKQTDQILQSLTHSHTTCLGSAGHWPRRRATWMSKIEIKVYRKNINTVGSAAHKVHVYYFNSASGLHMNYVTNALRVTSCWLFTWDLSYIQHREHRVTMCTPQQVVYCIIYHSVPLWVYSWGFRALNTDRKPWSF